MSSLSAEDKAKKRKEVVGLVRSCLISSKGGVELERLQREYRELVGQNIPWRVLGHSSLEEFLDHGRDFCRVRNGPQGYVISAVATESNAHIKDLVSKQSSKSKKGRPKIPSRFPQNPSQWKPNFSGMPQMRMRTNNNNNNKNYGNNPQQSRRYGAMSNNGRPMMSTRGPMMHNQQQSGGYVPQRQPNDRVIPIHNTLKRLPNNVSNSSPSTINLNNSNSTNKNYVRELSELCQTRGLPKPEYKTCMMSNKKHVSAVIVDEQRFRTCPDECSSADQAENAAAKQALESLKSKSNTVSFPPSSAGDASSNIYLESRLVDDICVLVGKRTNGVWSTQIEVEYKRKFKKELPSDWALAIGKIKDCKLRIDSPIEGRYIVLPNLGDMSANSNGPSSAAATTTLTNNGKILNGTNKRNGFDDQQHPRPPMLKFPDASNNFWNVFICHVTSTDNVFIRLLGEEYSTKFDELATDMEMHYYTESEFASITSPKVGKIYAAKYETEWHRVEVVEIRGIQITCYFIDIGEQELVPTSNLKELDPKFLELAPQAFRIRLSGLESFNDSAIAASEAENLLLHRSLVGEVAAKNGDDIALILHDTSTDTDENLNQSLVDCLTNLPSALVISTSENSSSDTSSPASPNERRQEDSSPRDFSMAELASFKELSPPLVPKKGEFFDITVTLAASPSNFTVQSWNDGIKLEELMNDMNKFYSNPKNLREVSKEDILKDHYYSVQHANDGFWYRARVNSMLDDSTLAVRFVDFGDISMIPCEKIQVLWPQFRNLPMQAINATLTDIIPVNGDWTAQDTVWFSSRVVEKQFVSQIKDVNYEEDGIVRIGISLIDTKDPVIDIYVEKELVDAKRAVFLCL